MGSHSQQFPGGSDNLAGTLRIKIEAKKLLKQNLQPRDISHIQKGALLADWDMVAPTDIQENIQHVWEEYDSIQGTIAEALVSGHTAGMQLMELGANISTVASGGTSAIDLKNSNVVVPKYKIDSPLVYKGSTRREYTFTFPMMEWMDIYGDVIDPISDFRRYSCAAIGSNSTDTIEWPAVFSVVSSPYPFILIPDAALTNVQVTYKSPYKFGMPQSADLTLTFKDLRPLYRSSWGSSDGKISVGAANEQLAGSGSDQQLAGPTSYQGDD